MRDLAAFTNIQYDATNETNKITFHGRLKYGLSYNFNVSPYSPTWTAGRISLNEIQEVVKDFSDLINRNYKRYGWILLVWAILFLVPILGLNYIINNEEDADIIDTLTYMICAWIILFVVFFIVINIYFHTLTQKQVKEIANKNNEKYIPLGFRWTTTPTPKNCFQIMVCQIWPTKIVLFKEPTLLYQQYIPPEYPRNL